MPHGEGNVVKIQDIDVVKRAQSFLPKRTCSQVSLAEDVRMIDMAVSSRFIPEFDPVVTIF